ncbi:hypothetical protein J6590_034650 [Homalodisca vitripennis]|nr:hypothetical protein J6590_034650 [Homalodisca vitripennis]
MLGIHPTLIDRLNTTYRADRQAVGDFPRNGDGGRSKRFNEHFESQSCRDYSNPSITTAAKWKAGPNSFVLGI